ncbi:MAG: NAD(P)-binding protein, partial [Bacteroidales bacterium]|nr:NAD(P)-binding protein [Bacteroidales bacterium]
MNDTTQYEENPRFEEVNKMYTLREAIDEAKRCLNCRVPQCRKGCPIENNIPDFIHQLSMGNMGQALSVLNERTNLPAICGRVCPHENQCEGHCVLGKKGKPVRVGKLESFLAQFDADMHLTHERIPSKDRGRVAVIGSGPAGLTVAGDLARQGFNVVIFEGQEEAGGVLMYGIPEYRLPKAVVRKEIERIEQLGVRFVRNCLVGSPESGV